MKRSILTVGSFLMAVMFLVPSLIAQTEFWEPANGPFGGPARCIAITERDHILVGTNPV
jgi:hypothetical protein